MDNFNGSGFSGQNNNDPIPLDQDFDKPIPLDDISIGGGGISHAPLDLGGSSPVEMPKIEVPKPAPAAQKPAEKVTSSDRITGIKTFFTKLHPGALNFLDEQITKWLAENPEVAIKRTNIITGEIQGKKTDPNIIITVWF